MATKAQKQAQQEAIERLTDLIAPGDKVYCTLRHVSRSGMMRAIDLHVVRDGDMCWIGRSVAQAIGYTWNDKHDGIRMDGCGMDMGSALVYELSRVLFNDGYALKHSWL